MRRKTIFGTLIIATLLIGSIIPIVTAYCPGEANYWLVTNVTGDATYYEPTYQFDPNYKNQHIEVNTNYLWQPQYVEIESVWWQDEEEPFGPISEQNWHIQTNCQIKADDGPVAGSCQLSIELWHPSNNYPEFINWTIYYGKDRTNEAAFHILVTTDNETDPTWEITIEEFGDQQINWGTWYYKNLKVCSDIEFEIDFYDAGHP